MFSKSSKSQSSASQGSAPKASRAAGAGKSATFSVIGADVVINGDIRASVDLHVDGRVEGDISCATLVQGQDSHIKGHVEAQAARLAGNIEGAISVGELIIEESARIVGDVTYDSISVAPGAHVDGRFTHRGGLQSGVDLKLVSGEASSSA